MLESRNMRLPQVGCAVISLITALCLVAPTSALAAELKFSYSKKLLSPVQSLLGLTVGELTSNGYPSLVATLSNTPEEDFNETLIVLTGQGASNFTDHSYITTPKDSFSVSPSIGDYSVNGRVVIDRQADGLYFDTEPVADVYPIAANGTLETPVKTPIVVGGYFTAGELTSDGIPDIIYDNPGNGKVYVELGKANDTFGSRKEFTLGGEGVGELALADLTGNGKLDLIAVNSITDKVSVSLGNGNGEFESPTYYPIGKEAGKIAVADLNGDGKPDIVVSNWESNTIDVLINEGNGKFKEPVSYSSGGTHPDSIAVADFTGNGHPDIAVGNESSEDVGILLNKGNGTFESAKIYTVEGQPRDLVAGEFDKINNNKQDLVAGYETKEQTGIDILTNTTPVEEEHHVGALEGMAVTDPFNGTTSAVSNFSSNWSALGWASEKGLDRTTGWGPSNAYPTVTGAYYAPTVSDVGSGVADVATMSENPSLESRYFSLWLDMSTPSSTKSGYELTFTDQSTNTYEVKLSKWVSGTQTVLASKSSYTFNNGNSFALVENGGKVSAWTNTGSGFTELLSASDTTFTSGESGVEGAGNITRLTKFKVGELLTPVANTSAALATLALNDSFAVNESPLSDGGAFAALEWDNSTSEHNTGQVASGWGPYDAYSTINGAYWKKTSFADTGAGDAVAAKLTKNPEITSRYFALWLNMPNPASARSGYEVRFKETSTNAYEVVLAKWQSGTETVLASKANYMFTTGSLLALGDNDGTVSVWTKTGSEEYTQLLSAADSTYTSGYTGIEGSGNFERLTEFRGGPLPPL